jgi:hypothetical protein
MAEGKLLQENGQKLCPSAQVYYEFAGSTALMVNRK